MGFLTHVWLWKKSPYENEEKETAQQESNSMMSLEFTALYLGLLGFAGLFGSLLVDIIDKKT